MRLTWIKNYLFIRPRIRNILHFAGIYEATSQTNSLELSLLAKFSSNVRTAVEIGSYEGVSAAVIAQNMNAAGKLYCVDPWRTVKGKASPSFEIFKRSLNRKGCSSKIEVLRGTSGAMRGALPAEFDFIFVDGDHSWNGIKQDWDIVCAKLRAGGVVCLHDALAPDGEEGKHDSVKFYGQVIKNDHRFVLEGQADSLVVLRRI
jgi:predicted O-methyltransferase YrrM